METYNGQVRTPTDAIILFEACRMGILPRVQRRLSEKERQSIRSGSVFVWDEREAGMRRWTDGKSWSASRVSGSFLTYREMEGKRGGSSFVTPVPSRTTKTPDSGRNSADDGGEGEEGPDGYRYKPDGLMKQSFSITTSQGQHLHLISYYSRSHPTAQSMRQPSSDPSLSSIQIPKGMYPESTVNDQTNTPAVTRSPMPGAPNYVMAPSPTYGKGPPPPPPPHPYYPGFIPHPSGYVYPISPLHTPPGTYAIHPYAHAAGLPPIGYAPAPYGHPQMHMAAAPPMAYDQRPLRTSLGGGNSPQPPPTLQHSLSAPAISPLPPPQLSPSANMTSQTFSRSPNVSYAHNTATTQIDPRLTESVTTTAADNRTVDTSATREARGESQPQQLPHTTASQVPTINALVHSTNLSTKNPVVVTEVCLPDKENDRQGSTSPGGTKIGVPPQDIPSEKLGFREDMRALSKLDRVFARV